MIDIEALKPEMIQFAKSSPTREVCAIVLAIEDSVQLFKCTNISQDDNNFIISPEDQMKAELLGEILLYFHSHVNANIKASTVDLVECERSGKPWLIYNTHQEVFDYIEPCNFTPPLIGRSFSHGVLDCYEIIHDYYKLELGILLPIPYREDDWWLKGQNLYLDNYKKAGFISIADSKDLKPHDVILMQIRSKVPNHGAVYLGNMKILQHCTGRTSGREVYGGFWQKCTTHILRHKNLI